MSLSNALSSIYNPIDDENPNTDATLPPTDGTIPDAGAPDEIEMVTPTEQDNSCGCTGSALGKSFIQWLSANVDQINTMLDELEVHDDDSDYSPEQDPTQSTDTLNGQPKYDEFEEFGIKTDPISDESDQLDGLGADDPSSMDGTENPEEMEDENEQGYVRFVPNAHLVYKRQTEDGTFEELWFYNTGKEAGRSDEEIKKDILAGTDIDPKRLSSEDGTQQYTVWTVGNGQMIQIIGLTN